MNIKDFSAIIFDMDGVFIDTEVLVFKIFRQVFAPYNIDLTDEYQYKFIGQPFSSNLTDIRQDFGIEFDSEALRIQFDNTYEKVLSTSKLDVQEGVKEIVQWAQQYDFNIGLCTTSTRQQVNTIFNVVKTPSFDPFSIFQTVVTGDSVNTRKPHPEPYLTTAHNLQVQPHECLVIEDSLSGIQAAKAAGCTCVALRHPYSQHLDFSIADMEIDALRTLLDAFKTDVSS